MHRQIEVGESAAAALRHLADTQIKLIIALRMISLILVNATPISLEGFAFDDPTTTLSFWYPWWFTHKLSSRLSNEFADIIHTSTHRIPKRTSLVSVSPPGKLGVTGGEPRRCS
ncbi:hypothetical protein EVAR_24502_1 [Eumeta japonica]|uniref:Uncharacterized protein n=1 Tax=Eumeta variegata TaxID=151549 RepID=A0A4C1US33_EUMVA|nr:hypothetical protein EVAR_24502_1 [Eumeta japonica]